jgi:hypothetical protein
MSVPVSICSIVKACNNEESYQYILKVMRINLKHGAFTLGGCRHEPPCLVDEAAIAKLDARLAADLKKPQST